MYTYVQICTKLLVCCITLDTTSAVVLAGSPGAPGSADSPDAGH